MQLGSFRIFVFAALLGATGPAAPKPVWIDTDPAVTPGGHEVDDAFALLQAFGSPELAIRGVSVVFGNASLEVASKMGPKIVKEFGPKGLPVTIGSASSADLGKENDATRALAAALRKEKLAILVLGPATNIATVAKLYPELAANIEQVIAVAGRRPGQHFTAGTKQPPQYFRDFNFEMDPEAFRVLLATKIPVVLAPWEISSKVWMTRSDLAELIGKRPQVDTFQPAFDDWLAKWAEFGASGFNPFDTLAVGYLTDRADLTCGPMAITIESAIDDTDPEGKRTKPYLHVRANGSSRKVMYCSTASPAFKRHLMRRLETTP